MKHVPIPDDPPNAKLIWSHVVYKVKHSEDKKLSLKACIAPFGNEESQKAELHMECGMNSSFGMGIILPFAALNSWHLKRLTRNLCFCRPANCNHMHMYMSCCHARVSTTPTSSCYWLPVMALLRERKMVASVRKFPEIPFSVSACYRRKNVLLLLIAKIIDDFFGSSGKHRTVDHFLAVFNVRFSSGAVAHGPGFLQY